MVGLYIGGKDSLVKLWDAKSGRELCSLWVEKIVVKIFELVCKLKLFEDIMYVFAVMVTKILCNLLNGIKMVTGC